MKTCTTCGAEWPDDTKFCPSDGSPLRAADGTSLIGGVIAGRFHILEKLGEGGMGAVYLGEHVKMGRKSAIKVLTESLAQDTEAIARFNREAANAARIAHPNVCAIYDFGETEDGLIYLAMEFIEGEALTELLNREGPLGPYRAAGIIRQAGDALQAAHDLGIVHRDLKPDNIMITKGRADEEVVKVVDFGIAKAMGGEEGQKVTRTGLVVGTPEYMSPEQLSGDVLDGRSDIYSLALVLFRMLTGRLPFEAESTQEMMIKRLTDEPVKLNQALPGGNFPDTLQRVLDRALQRMPSERYDSASEFALEVVAAVSGEGPASRVDQESATQLLGTAPAAATARDTTEQLPKTRISAARPTVPMDAAGQSGQDKSATPETPMPRPSVGQAGAAKRKRKAPIVAAVASAVIVVGGGAAVVALGGREGDSRGSGIDSLQTANVPRESTAVPIDSASRVEARQERPGGGAADTTTFAGVPTNDATTHTRESDSGTVVANPADEVNESAIQQELINLGRALVDDPSSIASSRARAREIFETEALPDVLRSRAAQIVSESYATDSMARACEWIDLAIGLDPSNDSFRMYKQNLLSCQP